MLSMGLIIDILLGLAFLSAIIAGAIRGFCKQFTVPLLTTVSVLSASFLVAFVYPYITRSGILDWLTADVSGWFSADFYKVPIDSVETLQQTISGNYLRIISGMSENMYYRMVLMLEDSNFEITIGNFFGQSIVNSIVELILWILAYLAVKYLLKGIRYLLQKITKVVVFKTIDKIFGLIWAVIFTYFIVVGLALTGTEIIIAQFTPNFEPTFAQWITNSTLLKFAHNTNFFGSFLAEIFGLNMISLA